ncbi:MAG: trypsin-like peptidase domain-containing protein [Oscillospiraceae bacterium]
MYDDKNVLGNQTPNEDNTDAPKTDTHSYEYQPELRNTAEEILNEKFATKQPKNEEGLGFNPISEQTSKPNYQQSGWQTPPPPQQPQQQTQWTFNDYGPMSTPPKSPKKPKAKKEKKPRSANHGIKVFAVLMTVLFVLSTAGFGGYIVYDLYKNDASLPINQGDKPVDDNNGGAPSLEIGQTPNAGADKNKDGSLSGKEINDKVSASVVGVAVYSKTTGFQLAGQGSGIVMSKDGYIITNAHVVSSKTSNVQIAKIEVILHDGTTHEAQLVGGDLKTDLAVLKITADNLVPAEFGDSDKLSVGDRVIVIGNPSGLEYAGSFTQGVVSALSRNIYMSQLDSEVEYIQTDAAINPGNSGGAFINEFGQVVGISSAKLSAEGYEGMGFAIPINNAKDVIDSLIKNGYVSGRPKIGIQYKPISETLAQLNGVPKGLRVYEVEADSDAIKQGVLRGDIIYKMNGIDVFDSTTISQVLKEKKPGDKIVLTIYRIDENGKSKTVDITVTLGEMAAQSME